MRQAPVADRMPPQNLDAEQATLGCCLLDPGALAIAGEMLQVDDFYREAHRLLWKAIAEVRDAGTPVDIVTVAAALKRTGHLESIGGGEYLTALLHEVPTTAHVAVYANEVVRTSLARQAISFGAELQAGGYENPERPADLLGDAIHRLESLQHRASIGERPELVVNTFGSDLLEIERHLMRAYMVSPERTGIPAVDRATGGLEDAGYGLIMGDTNAGKSGLLRQIVLSTALQIAKPDVVLLFPLEEARWRWTRRSLGWLGHFNTRALRNLPFWQEEARNIAERRGATAEQGLEELQQRWEAAIGAFSGLPLVVCGGDLTIGQIEAHCRSVQRTHNIRLVGIDYAQKIGKPQTQNEEQGFREVAQRLVRLRDTLGSIPILAPSQITDVAGDRRPAHAQAFGREADTVIDIQRDRDKEGMWERKATLAVMKSRELDAGRWEVRTDFETGRWEDYREQDDAQAA